VGQVAYSSFKVQCIPQVKATHDYQVFTTAMQLRQMAGAIKTLKLTLLWAGLVATTYVWPHPHYYAFTTQ